MGRCPNTTSTPSQWSSDSTWVTLWGGTGLCVAQQGNPPDMLPNDTRWVTPVSPRQALLTWVKKYPQHMHIRQDVPYVEAMKGALSSRFCFVPRGKSAWS